MVHLLGEETRERLKGKINSEKCCGDSTAPVEERRAKGVIRCRTAGKSRAKEMRNTKQVL